jgi:hypothetical protein
MVELRLPNIKGATEREQLAEIRGYLFQLTEQLQFALNSIGTSSPQVVTNIPRVASSASLASTGASTQATFNSIKSLIIKSAEIVDAYYQEINRRLESVYVAQSDFGDYAQRTSQEIKETSTSTTQGFENVQKIITDNESRLADIDEDLQDAKEVINNSIQGVQDRVTGVNALLEDAKAQLKGSLDDLAILVTGLEQVIIGVKAYLKSGLLYYTDAGIPVYGLEIGQSVTDEISGEEIFNKYARFTSEKLSFYDNNGTEVAYISDKKLYIRIAQITVAFQIGGLIDLVMANGDVVEKWVGG